MFVRSPPLSLRALDMRVQYLLAFPAAGTVLAVLFVEFR